ncbi:DUF4175 domain-containing protein [Phreatobacter stygius]|uniref:DUF4175 domain-containing protein n=1 Tax=Phreatobacter stygius TaxID=1940610 RepID=A0A4D7B016_9HYPH|nr:DUF4175 domain-containing protein [Phreatobacter stygius]QCI62796.1 DUF4175 domain-containing protein [Phreatobacter stygius]
MIITRAIAIACLTVFAWLLWVTTGLFCILLAMGWYSGDPPLKLTYLTVLAAGALVGGGLCRYLAGRIEGPSRG